MPTGLGKQIHSYTWHGEELCIYTKKINMQEGIQCEDLDALTNFTETYNGTCATPMMPFRQKRLRIMKR